MEGAAEGAARAATSAAATAVTGTAARARANQKLYHARLHLDLLAAAVAGQAAPPAPLLEAVGQSVQWHLQQAYGWFLLELAGLQELPPLPPDSVAALLQHYPLPAPLRGELIELQHVEQRDGWLRQLLGAVPSNPASDSGAQPLLQCDWSEARLQGWHDSLAALIERMSDSLAEW